jgi:predicted amidohydrolase YtcJ
VNEAVTAAETGDPPGGLIDRDITTGEPTGILYSMGAYLAEKIPPIDDAAIDRGLVQANQGLLSCGITSLYDVSAYNDLHQWKRFERWVSGGLVSPRITMAIGINSFSEAKRKAFRSRIAANRLKAGGIKIILDESTGSINPGLEMLRQHVMAVNGAGLQVIIHAVEEQAISAACDAIEQSLLFLPRSDHRHRIDHCSLCPPSLIQRLRALGVVVATQPSFIVYNGDRYMRTVPERQRRYLYPIGSMIEKGVHVCASSDFPIAEPNPMIGIYGAVARRSRKGDVVNKEEQISAFEALTMYTLSGAKAGFEERTKGSITRGKLADFVVLSDNPLTDDPERIKDIRVEMTIIGGRVVWRRKS